MKLYAASAPHRSRQLLGDVLLLFWVVLWIKIAQEVHDATLLLGTPGERMVSAGDALASRLNDAGDAMGGLPLVGDQARETLGGASDAALRLSDVGQAQADAVGDLAMWLGISVAVIPILIVVAFYVPLRLRFIREASAGQRFIDAAEDLDLFALRAMTRQPMHRLARITDDPAGAWRRGDADVIRRLAELELKDAGLSPPPQLG